VNPPHPRQSRDLSPKRGEVWVGLFQELEKLTNKHLAPFRGEVAALPRVRGIHDTNHDRV
jgi:hypothetical protein